jgi:small subunit ribosomal protein S2
MNDNLQTIQDNSIDNYTKNEQIKIHKDTDKLLKFYGGIRTMRRLPSVLLILDPVHDLNAVLEARKLNIPIIAFANTNADPDLIDYIVPLNNNSIRSIAFVLGVLNDAICSVLGEPLNFVGKKDSEIVLPPPAVKKT